LPLNVDGVRLSDLTVAGLIGAAVAVVGIGGMLVGLVDLVTGADWVGTLGGGALALLFGAVIAYEEARPEVDTHCAACGAAIRVHSSREGSDEAIMAKCSNDPKRAQLGPLSVVTEERKAEWTYCSGECAAADDRLVLGATAEPTPTEEVSPVDY
jgi:hypothetical protein